ncbi:hypothetical protein LJC16_00620 [Bacteroidales bacterium OttesenSCG-928-C19]|nr:hypothetical protein [Bacteroidales bacterium OttesenSCG-928-C19]
MAAACQIRNLHKQFYKTAVFVAAQARRMKPSDIQPPDISFFYYILDWIMLSAWLPKAYADVLSKKFERKGQTGV